jgi:hypothetical protein
MSDQLSSTSSVRLGVAVAWPAFWTAVPFKIGLALLFLALGVHPWEMPGLAFLILCSMPFDIWAWGLSARTVFLERLRLEPPAVLGLGLWARVMAATAIYGPLAYVVQSGATGVAKSVTHSIMELELLKSLPVAERIGVELTLWGAPATIVLLVLTVGWFSLVGAIVRRQARAAAPAQASYQGLVRAWDLMRVPSDQPLLLTAFTATGVLLVFLFWGAMPVTTPHPHESYKEKDGAKKAPPVIKPVEALEKSDKLLAQAEAALAALEAKKQAEEEEQSKGKKGNKAAGKGSEAVAAKPEAPKAVNAAGSGAGAPPAGAGAGTGR